MVHYKRSGNENALAKMKMRFSFRRLYLLIKIGLSKGQFANLYKAVSIIFEMKNI